MWTAPPIFFDDEDEEVLKAKFILAVARYPEHSIFDIAQHIFKDLRDNTLRADQAATHWMKDIETKERIRIARLNGGKEPEAPETKEAKLKKLEAVYDNPEVAVKDRIAAMRLHSELEGQIIKSVEKKVDDGRSQLPQIVWAVRSNAA